MHAYGSSYYSLWMLQKQPIEGTPALPVGEVQDMVFMAYLVHNPEMFKMVKSLWTYFPNMFSIIQYLAHHDTELDKRHFNPHIKINNFIVLFATIVHSINVISSLFQTAYYLVS